jgi:hypothetical protein
MIIPGVPARRCRFGALVICVVLGLAALALPIEGSQPLHVHNTSVPSIYNGECLLSALAAFQGTAPLPSPLPSVWAGIIPGAVPLTSVARFSVPVARHTDPRAPPARLI